jgi:hypothetical protein
VIEQAPAFAAPYTLPLRATPLPKCPSAPAVPAPPVLQGWTARAALRLLLGAPSGGSGGGGGRHTAHDRPFLGGSGWALGACPEHSVESQHTNEPHPGPALLRGAGQGGGSEGTGGSPDGPLLPGGALPAVRLLLRCAWVAWAALQVRCGA